MKSKPLLVYSVIKRDIDGKVFETRVSVKELAEHVSSTLAFTEYEIIAIVKL